MPPQAQPPRSIFQGPTGKQETNKSPESPGAPPPKFTTTTTTNPPPTVTHDPPAPTPHASPITTGWGLALGISLQHSWFLWGMGLLAPVLSFAYSHVTKAHAPWSTAVAAFMGLAGMAVVNSKATVLAEGFRGHAKS